MTAENCRVLRREVLHQPVALAIFRHMRDAERAHVRRVTPRNVGAFPGQHAGRWQQAGNCVQQLRLAVAGDAGDADDLAAANLERYARKIAAAEIVDFEQRLARARSLAMSRRATWTKPGSPK